MPISDLKLRELIGTEEGQYHDLKSMLEGPPGQKRPRDRRAVRDQIAEQVAGFANADGGVAIFGVEDDGTLSGHAYPPDVIDQMLAVPHTRLVPPQVGGARRVLGGHELLVFEIEPSARAVRVDGDGYPYRIGDTTRQFSEERINAIKDQGIVESSEARRSSVNVAALDAAMIGAARESSGAADLTADEYLVRRRLADRNASALVLREAAVLLFAGRPETIAHPNAGIRVFRVAGTERRTGARHNVQEFPRIEGNLPTVLQQARSLLETLIQRSARLHDLFFQEMPEYPTFAWQEALVNAVAHRDYGVRGQSIEVTLFDDRLEIASPGLPPPEVSIDDLRVGRPTHASRNPRIARVLAELGVMREQGEGIPRMFEEMELSFLPMPEIDLVSGRFVVTLRNAPIFTTDDPAWSKAVRDLPLSVTQKRALVGLIGREFANADYCELNGVDRDTAYRDLHELVDRGLLAAAGSGAGTRYRIVRDAISPVSRREQSPMERLTARMQEVGYVTNTDYREAFGVDRHVAKQGLARLVERGALTREGTRRHARYKPTSQWPPP